MMVSITNSRFTQDRRACLAAAQLSRHVTLDLVNVVEKNSLLSATGYIFDIYFTSGSHVELSVEREPVRAVQMITRSLRKS